MVELHVGRAGRRKFTLPVDIAGETIAVLAKRGAGKSNTAAVIVEELVSAGVQVVLLDPIGAHWGLRFGADGESPGLSIPILGGRHGDVPLEDTAGALIADVVVDTGSSMLLDLSDFESKAAANRFATEFAKRLYYRKGRSPSVTHLVLEEADQFCPQGTPKGETHMKSSFDRLVRLGRQRGIGITMVTQRSAKLNKDILTQADILVAMRTPAPHDRAAIRAWIDHRGEQAKEVMDTVPGLDTGEAWFWAPERDLLERVQVRLCSTYDSRRQAKPGEELHLPTEGADIDLEALGEEIAATVEKAKANDPKELRKRIAQLEAELRKAKEQDGTDPAELQEARDRIAELAGRIRPLERVYMEARNRLSSIRHSVDTLLATLDGAVEGGGDDTSSSSTSDQVEKREVRPGRPAKARSRRSSRETEEDRPQAQQRILDALATLEQIGVDAVTRNNLAVFSQQSPKSSAYQAHVASLEQAGLVRYPGTGMVQLTDEGRGEAAPSFSIESAEDLHEAWLSYLKDPQARILQVLLDLYPADVDRSELAELADQSPRSSAYQAHVATLEQLGAVEYPAAGRVAATDLLFPEGLR